VITLPRRLRAGAPGWTRQADVVVVGSGVAGLSVALRVRRSTGARVLLVTKTTIDAGSTRWAQGGIAAALGELDSPAAHMEDTLEAGVGICSPRAVEVLVTEGPARVRELAALGASFDASHAGGSASPEGFALTREGGHHADRIVHSGGDATGAEVQRALVAAVQEDDGIELLEGGLVVDLLRAADGAVCGATLHVLGEGQRDGVGAVLCRAVVLATGGLGQVFASTTNPSVSTGDGVAAALRAGAAVADLEFVQFHPTALWLGRGARGQQPLVSEAVRGEGAVLVDGTGARVMTGVHPLGDLAPRDVVAKAMSRRMAALATDHLFLDARGLGRERLERRFPTIVARCREAGVDPVKDLIPVTPAAHYASGGVRVDLAGRSSVPGLLACGEVACTGVHGANRLASNSLLEGLVFAERIAELLGEGLAPQQEPAEQGGPEGLLRASAREGIARTMTDGVGVLRSAASMEAAGKALRVLAEHAELDDPAPDAWETSDLHAVATVMTEAALRREETRGSHWREDFPAARPEWRGHQVQHLDDGGVLHTRFELLP
jgi:L-aspartate oxidase